MKTYQFYEFDGEEGFLTEMNEDEILDYYWNYWNEKMLKKYGHGHELITPQNCIEDFCIIHWAWEKKLEN